MVTRKDSLEYVTAMKAVFVEYQLSALLRVVDNEIIGASYSVEKSESGEFVLNESVTISFKSGFTRNVNVTADSYKALVNDVLRAL